MRARERKRGEYLVAEHHVEINVSGLGPEDLTFRQTQFVSNVAEN